MLAAAAVILAGCTDPEPRPDPGDAPADEPQNDLIGEHLGTPTGIDVSALADPNAPGTLEGVVYGLGNGMPLERASVFATCLRADLVPGFTHMTTTNATGGFAVPATGGLSDCLQITYEIQAAGFRLAIPLSSGPIADGTATFVYAGMAEASLADGTPA